jgi:hypothetical protein
VYVSAVIERRSCGRCEMADRALGAAGQGRRLRGAYAPKSLEILAARVPLRIGESGYLRIREPTRSACGNPLMQDCRVDNATGVPVVVRAVALAAAWRPA